MMPPLPVRWLALGSIAFSSSFAGDLKLPSVFSDHLVLQRGQEVPVWGWSQGGAAVTVQFAGQIKKTVAEPSGRWSLKLDALSESREGRELAVEAGEERVVVRDVLVGEVWLCSGQSNMAMTVDGKTAWLHVGGIADAKEVVRRSENPLLRQFKVEWKTATTPQENAGGAWTVAGPDTTAEFSATGYFFARELHERLGVPVAIVNASFGGSSVRGWISREGILREGGAEEVATMNTLLDQYEHHDERLARYAASVSEWEKTTGRVDPEGSLNDALWVSRAPSDPVWSTVQLPAPLSKLGCPEGGVVWLRKEFEIAEGMGSSWRFEFPACRAYATLYLNGVQIFEGTAENGGVPNRPAGGKGVARSGKNTLVVKLHGYSGSAGLSGGALEVVPFAQKPEWPRFSLMGDWQMAVEKRFEALPPRALQLPPRPQKGALHFMNVPALYNAMIHPLIPFAIRGVAWYQGESNVGDPLYGRHLQILVRDWRRLWSQGDFPFYVAQLAGFGVRKKGLEESPWAECREQQMAVLQLPHTGIANLIDTCEDGDLHPVNKQDPGRRLAWVALANTYGLREVVWSGPRLESARKEGSQVAVRFKSGGTGLAARPLPPTTRPNLRNPELPAMPLELPSPGSALQGFALSERVKKSDGTFQEVWHPASARIEGDGVRVWSEKVPDPVGVRYAWADHPVGNLYNREGLPAFPFRVVLNGGTLAP
jgi:sialate O-acetylesterase